MTITVGTDTYISVTDADDYFSSRYGYDSWALLDNTNKEKALVSATQHLDLLCNWYGYKSDSDQDLEFPRSSSSIDADPTPQDIKDAECEIAFAITSTGSTVTDGGDALTELKAGSVTMKFKATSTSNPIVNDLTLKLLAPYGSCSGGGAMNVIRT